MHKKTLDRSDWLVYVDGVDAKANESQLNIEGMFGANEQNIEEKP
jgi:hypothetical protein